MRHTAGLKRRLCWRLVLMVGTLAPLAGASGEGATAFEPLSSNPENLTYFQGAIILTAEDGRHGRELWWADVDGNVRLIKDLTRGARGTRFTEFYPFRDELYFGAGPEGEPRALWKTDGTAEGTVRVFDVSNDTDVAGLTNIVASTPDWLYVAIGDSAKYYWVTDGVDYHAPLQKRLATTWLQINHSHFAGVTVGETLYIATRRDSNRFGIARVQDGDKEIEILHEFTQGPASFAALPSGAVLFSGYTKEAGAELWVTEGTPESTRPLKEIYPGPESSNVAHFCAYEPVAETSLLFTATAPESGREIWITDGTPAGTRLWLDLNPGAASSNPYKFTYAGDDLYFIATNEVLGKEVWRYNASLEKPIPISDANPGVGHANPYTLCIGYRGVYFSAEDQHGDEELWHYDTTDQETRRLRDINPGPEPSYPDYTIWVPDSVVTVATDPVVGRELWIHDWNGDFRLLADIYSDDSVNPSSRPREMTPAGDLLYFVANDIEHGAELWSSDGTEAGTAMVRDIFQGRPSSNPKELTAVGDLLYFVADDGVNGYCLWRSDGTEPGTVRPEVVGQQLPTRVSHLTALSGTLLFSAFRPYDGEELWIVRPGENPEFLLDINPGEASSTPRDFVVWNGHVYFRADDGVHGEELWRTDGTAEGTAMVKDIVNAPVEGVSASAMSVTPQGLYLSANVDGGGTELWRLDAADNIQLVRDIARGDIYRLSHGLGRNQ